MTYSELQNYPNFQIPDGWEIVPVGSKNKKSYRYFEQISQDSKNISNWRQDKDEELNNIKIKDSWFVCIRRKKVKLPENKVNKEKDISIPDGWELVKVGEKIPVGSKYFPGYMESILSGSKDIKDWKDDNLTINQIREAHWLLSIKPVKVIEKTNIPFGYKIIQPGEIIPNEYWLKLKGGSLNIDDWSNGSGSCAGLKRSVDNFIFIRKSLNNIDIPKKKYVLELTEEQRNLLKDILEKAKEL